MLGTEMTELKNCEETEWHPRQWGQQVEGGKVALVARVECEGGW